MKQVHFLFLFFTFDQYSCNHEIAFEMIEYYNEIRTNRTFKNHTNGM